MPNVGCLQGKIRVFARVRPMLAFEQAKGQTSVLDCPDELTLTHMWKGAKREYAFDSVFQPSDPQDKVCKFAPRSPVLAQFCRLNAQAHSHCRRAKRRRLVVRLLCSVCRLPHKS